MTDVADWPNGTNRANERKGKGLENQRPQDLKPNGTAMKHRLDRSVGWPAMRRLVRQFLFIALSGSAMLAGAESTPGTMRHGQLNSSAHLIFKIVIPPALFTDSRSGLVRSNDRHMTLISCALDPPRGAQRINDRAPEALAPSHTSSSSGMHEIRGPTRRIARRDAASRCCQGAASGLSSRVAMQCSP